MLRLRNLQPVPFRLILVLLCSAWICPADAQYQIDHVAGNGQQSFGVAPEGIPASTNPVSPYDLAIDKDGNIYFSEASWCYCVRKIDATTGLLTTVAGNGIQGYSGDNGPARLAKFNEPRGIVLDSQGNLYIADYWNHVVRKVDALTGIVTSYAGNGSAGFSGDGGPSSLAKLFSPDDLALDPSGNLLIADLNNFVIRRVNMISGIIETVAGTPRLSAYFGDGGHALNAAFGSPMSVAVDTTGNIFVADWSNNRIRKIAAADGIISTVAGTGTLGNAGDGGLAVNAELYGPQMIEVDQAGHLYVTEYDNLFLNAKIRKVNKCSGRIYPIAGNGVSGYSGDGGPALEARIYGADHLIFADESTIYLADLYNHRIRRLSKSALEPPVIAVQDSCKTTGTNFQLQAAYPVQSVQWDFGDPASGLANHSEDIAPHHSFSSAGTFTVQATSESDFGCEQAQLMLEINPCDPSEEIKCPAEIPNVLTPNHDGWNDVFRISSQCPLVFYELWVYNRWGEPVFEGTLENPWWNGTAGGKDCPEGTYFVNLRYAFADQPIVKHKGPITLIR